MRHLNYMQLNCYFNISETKLRKKFNFTVKEENDNRYPFMEGSSQKRKWTKLK